MPRYLKQNGKKVPNVTICKAWIVVPLRNGEEETYLVPTRLAEYIVRLENKIVGDLPKLPKK